MNKPLSWSDLQRRFQDAGLNALATAIWEYQYDAEDDRRAAAMVTYLCLGLHPTAELVELADALEAWSHKPPAEQDGLRQLESWYDAYLEEQQGDPT